MLNIFVCSPVAQLVEQVAVNHWVSGSSPFRGAIHSKTFNDLFLLALFTIAAFDKK
jgi:hypothetical protein